MACLVFLNLPLYETSSKNIKYNINFTNEIQFYSNNIDIKKDYLYHYPRRRSIYENMNLSNFIKTFTIINGKLIKRKVVDLSMVVYFSPVFLPYKSFNNYFKYCMYQLVKYRHWRDISVFCKEVFSDDE